jgi:chromosome segregation ATPase
MVSLTEAAELLGIGRQPLWQLLRSRNIAVHRVVWDGQTVSSVAAVDVARLSESPEFVQEYQGDPGALADVLADAVEKKVPEQTPDYVEPRKVDPEPFWLQVRDVALENDQYRYAIDVRRKQLDELRDQMDRLAQDREVNDNALTKLDLALTKERVDREEERLKRRSETEASLGRMRDALHEAKRLEGRLAKLEPELDSTRARLKDQVNRNRELEKAQRTLDRTQDRLTGAEGRAQSLTQKLDEESKKHKFASKQLEQRIEEGRRDAAKLRDEVRSIQESRTQVHKQLLEKEEAERLKARELFAVERELKSKDMRLQALTTKLDEERERHTTQRTNLEERIKKYIEDAAGMRQELREARAVEKRLAVELQTREKQNLERTQALQNVETELESTRTNLQETREQYALLITEHEGEMARYAEERELLDQRAEEHQAEKKALREQLTEGRKHRTSLEFDILGREKRERTLSKELLDARGELDSTLAQLQETETNLKKTTTQLEVNARQHAADVRKTDLRFERHTKDADELRRQLEEGKEVRSKLYGDFVELGKVDRARVRELQNIQREFDVTKTKLEATEQRFSTLSGRLKEELRHYRDEKRALEQRIDNQRKETQRLEEQLAGSRELHERLSTEVAAHEKREREQAEQLQQTQVELTSVSAHLDASEARSVAMGEKLQSDDSLHAGDREELERRVEAQVAESERLRKERLELEGAHTALGVQFAEQEALQRTRLKDLLRVQGELDSTTTRLRASEARHASLGEKLQVEATRHAEEREELETRSNEERRQVALLREELVTAESSHADLRSDIEQRATNEREKSKEFKALQDELTTMRSRLASAETLTASLHEKLGAEARRNADGRQSNIEGAEADRRAGAALGAQLLAAQSLHTKLESELSAREAAERKRTAELNAVREELGKAQTQLKTSAAEAASVNVQLEDAHKRLESERREQETRAQERSDELEQAREQLKALTEERAKLKAELLNKEQEARTHENEVTSLMGDLDASETRLRKTEMRHGTVAGELNEAKRRHDEDRRKYLERLGAELGTTAGIQRELEEASKLHQDLQAQITAQAAATRERAHELSEVRRELDATRSKLDATQMPVASLSSKLEAEMAQHTADRKRFETESERQRKKAADLQAELERARKSESELRSQLVRLDRLEGAREQAEAAGNISTALSDELERERKLHAQQRKEFEMRAERRRRESADLDDRYQAARKAHVELGVALREKQKIERLQARELLELRHELDATRSQWKAVERASSEQGDQTEALRESLFASQREEARLKVELELQEVLERANQRYCDNLEERIDKLQVELRKRRGR